VGARTAGLVLTADQRCAAQQLDAAARQCGSSLRSWVGFEFGESGGRELRLVAQTHCGTRACARCAEMMREHQRERVAGPWKLFLTLTFRPAFMTVSDAWGSIHSALRTWWRELRRQVAYRDGPITARTAKGQASQRDRKALAGERVRGPEGLEYAWCLEAHVSGYPHVHLVTNQEFVDYRYAKSLWEMSMSVETANVDGEQVYEVDGACRYLCQYVAKAHFSLDILAIIKGRRVWASTIKAPEKVWAGWIPDKAATEKVCRERVEERESWGAEEGWTLQAGADGRYGLWARDSEFQGALGPCVGQDDDIGESEDVKQDYKPALIRMFSESDSSIIVEEWLHQHWFGKIVDRPRWGS